MLTEQVVTKNQTSLHIYSLYVRVRDKWDRGTTDKPFRLPEKWILVGYPEEEESSNPSMGEPAGYD